MKRVHNEDMELKGGSVTGPLCKGGHFSRADGRFMLADARTVAGCTSGARPTLQTPTVTPGSSLVLGLETSMHVTAPLTPKPPFRKAERAEVARG